MDELLKALLMQIDEIYTKTKSGEISNVEDMGENIVGTKEFIILAEPSVDPVFYNYITNHLNIRLSKNDLINQTVIFDGDEVVLYSDLNYIRAGERIKSSIIDGTAQIGDVTKDAEMAAEEARRGSR